ncbi:MAG: class I SAM-dependent methyltransferase [bacterium]|nr:class I SAM-dependent methyltransferase [bacterium]
MSENLRSIYAEKALSQIPRLLGLQDRNTFSPTYGCFKRTYWLDKTVDFPDALPQFGVLSMTLAYTHDLPGNIYKDQPKMLEWILAGMRYWTTIQHRDGSFDEFYPNEHGWTGPTGFLLYGMLKSYMLLKERGEFPAEFEDAFFTACSKAADFIIKWDEHGVLANHHAMGVLPVYYAYHVIGDKRFLHGYEKKLAEFLEFHTEEGWSLEYDGADIGYLSATVSFLGKVYKIHKDPRLKKVMEESIEFLSHFAYPNGFYAGSMGSRNTLHFYSHGCEILAPEMPLAGRVADAMLESLGSDKIISAEIQADRYFLYRIPEHLESYIDYGQRIGNAQLPYEREDFRKVFDLGRYYVQKKGDMYLLGNAAKGGVTKLFSVSEKKQLTSDCGVIGTLTNGDVVSSQWIDPDYRFVPKENGFSVSGALHVVPANKLFTPVKLIVFRVFLLVFGWHTGMAYRIKGLIRKLLMLKSGSSSALFYRDVELSDTHLRIADTIKITGKDQFASLQLGDEFFVRYVPQSRYFQSQEFDAVGVMLSPQQLKELNTERKIRIERSINLETGEHSEPAVLPVLVGTMGLEYSEGRKSRKALTYRLRRRADEVIRSIQTYHQGTPLTLLDLGPAEGKSLSYVQDVFPDIEMTGLEFSPELIDACTDSRLRMVEGDAMDPPFRPESFDIISATALIEHVESPINMLKKMHSLLRPGGLMIITTPDPFFERIAGAIGHLDDEAHQETMTTKTLDRYLREAGFEPVEVEKFMCWPWGLPGELGIESLMKKIGLRPLLLNQLAVGRKLSK